MFLSRSTWSTTFVVLNALNVQSAQLQLGQTTLTGLNIPTLGQEFFGGIPYAEPPVGQLRLQPPVGKYALNSTTFNATQYGPGCLQPATDISGPFSEDCLTINILRPAGTPTGVNLPVMAWIYGGGFTIGTASNDNGTAIVGQSLLRGTPIIYVNFNYRLGPLGFPQGQEADDNNVLNLGLKDQLVALQWIQQNIGSFGGDASKVTVFGESAGAISIAVHLLRPSFAKLARAVILESGAAASSMTNYAATRGSDWDAFVASVPACASAVGTNATIACLRNASLNAATLINATVAALSVSDEELPYVPTLDGELYLTLPSIILASGSYAKLPFIAGANLDEGTQFVINPAAIHGEADVRTAIIANYTPSLIPGNIGTALLNASSSKLLTLYPDVPALGSPYNTGNETFGLDSNYKRAAAINGDLFFHSQRRLLQQVTSAQGVKSFGYLFTDSQPQVPAYLGVVHASEVSYVYGNCASRTPATQALCLSMINYWVSFATSLDPNDGKGGARPAWPQYTPQTQVLLELNSANTSVIPDTYRKEQIDFINLNSVTYHHRRMFSRRNTA